MKQMSNLTNILIDKLSKDIIGIINNYRDKKDIIGIIINYQDDIQERQIKKYNRLVYVFNYICELRFSLIEGDIEQTEQNIKEYKKHPNDFDGECLEELRDDLLYYWRVWFSIFSIGKQKKLNKCECEANREYTLKPILEQIRKNKQIKEDKLKEMMAEYEKNLRF